MVAGSFAHSQFSAKVNRAARVACSRGPCLCPSDRQIVGRTQRFANGAAGGCNLAQTPRSRQPERTAVVGRSHPFGGAAKRGEGNRWGRRTTNGCTAHRSCPLGGWWGCGV